jgi:hypothetical protein
VLRITPPTSRVDLIPKDRTTDEVNPDLGWRVGGGMIVECAVQQEAQFKTN